MFIQALIMIAAAHNNARKGFDLYYEADILKHQAAQYLHSDLIQYALLLTEHEAKLQLANMYHEDCMACWAAVRAIEASRA